MGGSSGGSSNNSAMMNMMMIQMIQQQQNFEKMMAEQQASRDDANKAREEAKASMPITPAVASSSGSEARQEAATKAANAEGVSRTTKTSPTGLSTTAATSKGRVVGTLADPKSPALTRSVIAGADPTVMTGMSTSVLAAAPDITAGSETKKSTLGA